ncbi:MAG: DUF952 domain-containing protein [Actinomycetia bacterium]|nr:DUF952 domain-containing protein [Actinomycetes bacterium]MCH9701163.1 DUF952 domain-containing protein [Actinomycetes bacterium]MCH9762226.1 DUF952 domain-containing protein [Actinomycetes bacterium]
MCATEVSGPPVLVHLCTAVQWRAARSAGEVRPDSLREVGFVHLSRPEQVHLPANRLYAGRTDLLMLRIAAARLPFPVRWEPGIPDDPEGMVFPHLYGPLPLATVISVTAYLPDRLGVFAPCTG